LGYLDLKLGIYLEFGICNLELVAILADEEIWLRLH
jgi:hypothetical protein